jgi:hypothetical protein
MPLVNTQGFCGTGSWVGMDVHDSLISYLFFPLKHHGRMCMGLMRVRLLRARGFYM